MLWLYAEIMKTLTKYQFLALVALLRCPMHSYLLRQEIIELSGWQVWPSKSTLRQTLDSLLDTNYVEECRSEPNYWLKARRSAPYEITEIGYKVVRRELSMYFEIVVKSRKWLQKFDEQPHRSVDSLHVRRN